jgi:hypothetical protein
MTMSVDGGFADGLHALWNLLFECGLPDACEFVVDTYLDEIAYWRI